MFYRTSWLETHSNCVGATKIENAFKQVPRGRITRISSDALRIVATLDFQDATGTAVPVHSEIHVPSQVGSGKGVHASEPRARKGDASAFAGSFDCHSQRFLDRSHNGRPTTGAG